VRPSCQCRHSLDTHSVLNPGCARAAGRQVQTHQLGRPPWAAATRQPLPKTRKPNKTDSDSAHRRATCATSILPDSVRPRCCHGSPLSWHRPAGLLGRAPAPQRAHPPACAPIAMVAVPLHGRPPPACPRALELGCDRHCLVATLISLLRGKGPGCDPTCPDADQAATSAGHLHVCAPARQGARTPARMLAHLRACVPKCMA